MSEIPPSPYDRDMIVAGGSEDGLKDAICRRWEQTAETTRKLLGKGYGFKLGLKDIDGVEHEIDSDGLGMVEIDNTPGRYSVKLPKGAVVTVVGAAILAAGVVIYKQTSDK